MPLLKEDKEAGVERVFGVPSSRGTGIHEVIKWRSGVWSCNCTDWIIRRARSGDHTERTGDHCRHIKDCIAKRIKPAGTIYVTAEPERRAEGRAAARFGEDV